MRGQIRIEEMYAFILVDSDGTEGIPAFLTPSGVAMPLTGADMSRVESLRPIAEKLAKDHNKPITLVKFTHREELEVIYPDGRKD